MKPFRSCCLLLAAAFLTGCVASSEPIMSPRPPARLLLGAGDQLDILVLGQPDLSGIFNVDDAGTISMPLIGTVVAEGRTTASLENVIGESLRQDFLRQPDVTVQVAAYRPIFVMGEVGAPGQYSYVVGLTVQQAVAVAGGFSPRAYHYQVNVVRQAGAATTSVRLGMLDLLLPGDTITVRQRVL